MAPLWTDCRKVCIFGSGWLHLCLYECLYVCLCVLVCVCACVCTLLCACVCAWVCVHVCVYVCVWEMHYGWHFPPCVILVYAASFNCREPLGQGFLWFFLFHSFSLPPEGGHPTFLLSAPQLPGLFSSLSVVGWMRKVPHLSTWSLVGGTIWRDGAAFLEEACHETQALRAPSLTPLPVHCPCFCVWMEIQSLGFLPSHLLPFLLNNMDSPFATISQNKLFIL